MLKKCFVCCVFACTWAAHVAAVVGYRNVPPGTYTQRAMMARMSRYVSSMAKMTPRSIVNPGTITQPGVYRLTQDVYGTVKVDSDNVVLDLGGHQVLPPIAGRGIVLSGQNISVSGGTVTGGGAEAELAETGISVTPGSTRVRVRDVTVNGCSTAVDVERCRDVAVENVKMNDGVIGMRANAVENLSVAESTAANNLRAGFSTYNAVRSIFQKCRATAIGRRFAKRASLRDDGDDGVDVHGFMSSGGKANTFIGCAADNIWAGSTTNNTAASGVEIKYPETYSLVDDCKTTYNVGDGIAYACGLRMVPGNDSLEAYLDQVHGSTVNALEWSPDGNYLALGGYAGTGGYQVRVYSFDMAAGTLTALAGCDMIHGGTVRSVAWSPDGNYLAIGGQTGTGGYQVRVYAFEYRGGNRVLRLVSSMTHGATVNSVSWQVGGKFLAIGGEAGTGGYHIRVYTCSYGRLYALPLSDQIHGATVYSVAWHQSGQYLATGGDTPGDSNEIRVWRFASDSLTDVEDQAHGAAVYSVAWTVSGGWLAIGGATGTDGYQMRVYGFNNTLATLTLLSACNRVHGAQVDSVAWSMNNHYLALGGDTGSGSYEVRVYSFDDEKGLLFTDTDGVEAHGAHVYGIAWRFDGTYLAYGGIAGTDGYDFRIGAFNYNVGATSLVTESLTVIPGCTLPYDGVTEVRACSWDATGEYLALVGDMLSADYISIRVAHFDTTTQSLTLYESAVSTTETMETVSWHPSGRYFVTGGQNAVGNPVAVVKFDPVTGQLTKLPGCTPTVAPLHSSVRGVAWQSLGNYIAIAHAGVIDVYRFDSSTESLVWAAQAVLPGTRSTAMSVSWHANGTYLAVGGDTDLGVGDYHGQVNVYSFNTATGALTLLPGCTTIVTSMDAAAHVSWHPFNDYLACAGYPGTATLTAFQFDPSALTLTEIPGCSLLFGTVQETHCGISWDPDGGQLAVGTINVDGGTNEMIGIFEFDGLNFTISTSVNVEPPEALGIHPSWNPKREYLAISCGGNSPLDNARIYSTGLSGGIYPIKCIMQKNLSSHNKSTGVGRGLGVAGLNDASMVTSNLAYGNNVDFRLQDRAIQRAPTNDIDSLSNISLKRY